jgi:hypothetical protein
MTDEKCVYLGKDLGHDQLHECQLFEKCYPKETKSTEHPSCVTCGSKITLSMPKDDWVDPLIITNRKKEKHHAFRNMLAGGSAFLVCGGPSLKEISLNLLRRRGVFSLGVNNVAGYAPVDAFVCSDPPLKFHHGIFYDPKMMKFVPVPKLGGSRTLLKRKTQDSHFVDANKRVNNCPNVWGVERRGWLQLDDTWFTEPSASWGNMKDGVNRGTGLKKTACTMLMGIRILQYLGARKIFLLGCDFHMRPTVGITDNYAFKEDRDKNAVCSNNDQYEIANEWLVALRPVFERWGFAVYNCNQHSHLRAFDYVPFEKAYEYCKNEVPQEPWDLRGYYEKTSKYEAPEDK